MGGGGGGGGSFQSGIETGPLGPKTKILPLTEWDHLYELP